MGKETPKLGQTIGELVASYFHWKELELARQRGEENQADIDEVTRKIADKQEELDAWDTITSRKKSSKSSNSA